MSFRNLNFSPSTSTLFKTFFSIYRYYTFFLKFKTSILSNNRFAKLFKETSFSKAKMVMRFPANTNAGCPKPTHDFPPRKDGILHPPSGCLGTPLLLSQSLYGRARTLTSEPKFLRSIGYQICLAMELRWRALPAASTITLYSKANILSIRLLHDLLAGSACFLIPHFQSFRVRRGKFL